MWTDRQIRDLIALPKTIRARRPAAGYREEYGHERCDLELEDVSRNGAQFTVFIRKHRKFIENFSLGLRYHTNDRTLGTVTLIRYNGAHGETDRQPDGHYAKPHIHYLTEKTLASGSTRPQERHRETTDRYQTFEQALSVFFRDTGVVDSEKYFPELTQGGLFNGHPRH